MGLRDDIMVEEEHRRAGTYDQYLKGTAPFYVSAYGERIARPLVLDFQGEDLVIHPEDVAEDPYQHLVDLSSREDLLIFRLGYGVSGQPVDCRNYLRVRGLSVEDHDTNLDTLVWLTGEQFRRGHPVHFSTY